MVETLGWELRRCASWPFDPRCRVAAHSKTLRDEHAWQPLTNITLGPGPLVVQRPLDVTNRFYRGAWLP